MIKEIVALQEQFKILNAKVDLLESENLYYKSRIETLEKKITVVKAKSNLNKMLIHSIPCFKEE